MESSQAICLVAANVETKLGLKSNLKYWLRQFPFVVPYKIIDSCQEWIDSRRKQKGSYFNQRGPWYKTIFPESFIQNSEPKTLGAPVPKAFYHNRNYPTHKASLFYLQNCYLLGHKGLVITANNQVFQEFSHHFNISSLKKFFWRNPFYTFSVRATQVSGMGAVLLSPESHNYYHWLNDVLARIKLYEEVAEQVNYFCVASNVPEKFLEVLKIFAIPPEKVLKINPNEKLHFDHLFVSSLPGSEGRSPRWAIEYLRDKLIPEKKPFMPFKKLYFKRGNNVPRSVNNEDWIIQTLNKIGFEAIDPGTLDIVSQIELMQQAKIIIGTHGAALSNLIFCQHDTSVIEIFSPDYFRTDCYYTLSSLLKFNYWYIEGDKELGANWGDIAIPEDLLLKTIQQIDIG